MFHIPKTKDEWHTLTFGRNGRWKKTARLSIGIGTVLAGLGYGGPVGWKEFVTKPRERERWGTLVNPKFRVTDADILAKGGFRFSALLDTSDKNATRLNREFDEVDGLLSSPEGIRLIKKDPLKLSEYKKMLAALGGVHQEQQTVRGGQPPAPSSAPDLSNYLHGCSKQAEIIFTKMTGQDEPEGIVIKVDNNEDIVKDKKRLGYTRAFSSNIYLYSRNLKAPEDIVCTIIHEKGHLVSPISRDESDTAENRARDEACALSLEMGGALVSDNKAMQAGFEERYYGWLIGWYDGETLDCHALGAAICDAAISIHGGPGAAFNSLAYAGSLDPRIIAVIADNQHRWDQNRELRRNIPVRARKLLEKIKKVEEYPAE